MKIVGTTITGSVLVNGNDVTTNLQTLNVWSGSVASTIVSLNSTTSSLNNTTASFNVTISSLNAATASLLNYTASNNAAISDILLETASINTFTSSISSRTSIIESTYATTGSNIFNGNQTISGSLFISQNLVVQGSSSIQNITASAVSIGTNTVILNTDTPAVRFGGIKVQDSGSGAGVSGSLLWDSLNNHWIYQHPAGGAESGMSARLISGPKNSGSLGNEAGITSGKIIVAVGDDHIGDSIMTQTGTVISVAGDLTATSLTGSINGSQLTNSTVANAKLANSTISGIALGNNLATLTIGTGLSGTSYNGSGAVTIANTGVTSIVAGTNISISGGTGAVTITNGITNNNQLTNGAGYITSAGTSADSNLLNGISAVNLFNNMGAGHGTRSSFDASSPSYGFGFRFVQGSGNGPGTSGGQFYSWYIGLGSDYPATGGGSYGAMFAVDRNVTNPYLSVRYNENNSFGSWRRIHAGYADTAGSAPANGGTSSNTNSISSAVGGSYTWTGTNQFQTNNGGSAVNNSNTPSLQAYSTGNNTAFMSFHKGGHYAINMGLDSDNVFRIGGWSAGGNRLQMDMSGNLTMAGDVTAFSDARVKENVVTVDNALNKLLALRGVYYNRTDSDDKRTKLGVIAQEILKVIPEVVSQDNDGMYNVSYGNLAGLFIEAIKEQQAQIEELKAKLG